MNQVQTKNPVLVQRFTIPDVSLLSTVHHAGTLTHLDSCHIVTRIRYRTSRTISYVQTYDIVRTVLDVVCYIVYTISYIRYSVTGPTILDLRMLIRYRMSTYDIVGQTYDIVTLHENISYTISYVQKYVRCRTSVTYDIVRAHRIRYRMSFTISYVYLRYRMLTYDIVC